LHHVKEVACGAGSRKAYWGAVGRRKGVNMGWILAFLILAIIFAAVGFGLAIAALKILFYIFVALLLISLVTKGLSRV
jgi:uncharacterized membrane protein YtjA (UPF0391 family)